MSNSSGTNGFSLDISGVAGFFGGDASVSAMATVHIYEGRKWLGWYNQPGSYEIARRYGQLSRSRLWDALYPGVNVDPAVLFEFDGTPVAPLFQVVRPFPLPPLCVQILIYIVRAQHQTCFRHRSSGTSPKATPARVRRCSTRSAASGTWSSASQASEGVFE